MQSAKRPTRRPARRRTASKVFQSSRSAHYRQLRHPFSPQAVFNDDFVATLHEHALKLLETLGIKILLPEARQLFLQAGARVDDATQMVFIGREIVSAALDSAPKSITLRAANGAREQTFELGAMLFSPGAGCPNATDRERGRRPGSLEAFEETLKLVQSFDVMHTFGPCVEPQDVPPNERHYAIAKAQLLHGDKPMFAFARGHQQAQECFEMVQLALGVSAEEFQQHPWLTAIINTNSPRQLDIPMAQGILDFARAGQLTVITPFCLAGAMAPVTVEGALTLQHAEALMGIALAQLAKPGAPVAYGGFSSNVDMKSGSPAFGTPEHIKMQIGSGQLARYIGMPWRSASGSAANIADMQAANETNMALWGALMANATLTLHTAGWLEGGLSFGYEKFINDIEALQTLAELAQQPEATEAAIGFDALAEVPPGGHFFATGHTMSRYQEAFYPPLVADLSNFGAWQEAGEKTADQRATSIWQAVLRDFKSPVHAGEAMERLTPYIERRVAAGGAAVVD